MATTPRRQPTRTRPRTLTARRKSPRPVMSDAPKIRPQTAHVVSPQRTLRTSQAEPRTRDEYADHLAPPNSSPIEEAPPKPETEGRVAQRTTSERRCRLDTATPKSCISRKSLTNSVESKSRHTATAQRP